MSANTEFISYDGESPNLCSGTLVFKVNGKQYSLDECLFSGGDCCCGDKEKTTSGPWTVHSLPDELVPFQKEITEMVNKNVPWGCCGGCI